MSFYGKGIGVHHLPPTKSFFSFSFFGHSSSIPIPLQYRAGIGLALTGFCGSHGKVPRNSRMHNSPQAPTAAFGNLVPPSCQGHTSTGCSQPVTESHRYAEAGPQRGWWLADLWDCSTFLLKLPLPVWLSKMFVTPNHPSLPFSLMSNLHHRVTALPDCPALSPFSFK